MESSTSKNTINVETSSPPTLGIAKSIGLIIVFSIAHGLARRVPSIFGLEQETGYSILSGVLLAWPLVVWLSALWGGVSLRAMGLFRWISWGNILALIFASFGVVVLVTEIALRLPLPDSLNYEPNSSGTWPYILASILVVPFFEEVFFRGQLLSSFRSRYSTRKAVWATAILFSLKHIDPWSAAVALPFGFAFAWLAIRAGSIVPGLIIHIVLNLSSTVLLPRVAQALGYSQEALWSENHLPLTVVVFGVVATSIGLIIILRGLKSGQFMTEVNHKETTVDS